MVNIELNKQLFHIIRPCGESEFIFPFINVSHTFSSILANKAILTRDSLVSHGINDIFNELSDKRPGSWNRNDSVSICTFSGDDPLLKELYPDNVFREDDIRAYDTFGMDSDTITLVLNRDLINRYPVKYKCLRMPDEIQILGDIPISEIIAIGLYDKTFSERSLKLKNRKFIKNRIKYYCDSFDELFKKINILRELLKQYNMDIPVIDNCTGREFSSIEEEKELVLHSL